MPYQRSLKKLSLGLLLLALLPGCKQPLPLSSSGGAMPSNAAVVGQVEPSAGPTLTLPFLYDNRASVSNVTVTYFKVTNVNNVYAFVGAGPYDSNPNGSMSPSGGAYTSGAPMLINPSPTTFPLTCPASNCKNIPFLRGIGGANGDFVSDRFIRYRGIKGPDASAHYNRLNISVNADISSYQGISFWARGHGSFAVSLEAPNDNLTDAGPVPPHAYSDYNFFMKRFGRELNGDDEWKQVIVYFRDMVQEWGLAADRKVVLRNVRTIQFDQQSPVERDFLLDLDYIRLI